MESNKLGFYLPLFHAFADREFRWEHNGLTILDKTGRDLVWVRFTENTVYFNTDHPHVDQAVEKVKKYKPDLKVFDRGLWDEIREINEQLDAEKLKV